MSRRGRPRNGPTRSLRHGKNELLRIVLAAMENRDWLSGPMIRHLAGYGSVRPINFHLERYAHWNFIKRRGSWNAKPVYWRITRKGRRKLGWLREK